MSDTHIQARQRAWEEAQAKLAMPQHDSVAEANRLLKEAGWTPISKPVWAGTFCAGRLVGGVSPDGAQHVKNLDAVLPGDPRYGPDTPDEHHEAAAWLIEHARVRENPLTTSATLETIHATDDLGAGDDSAVLDFADRGDGAGGDRDADPGPADDLGGGGGMDAPADESDGSGAREGAGEDAGGGDEDTLAADGAGEAEPIDADFTEFGDAELEGGADLGAELLEFEEQAAAPAAEDPQPLQGQDRFIGLDDLDRRRSLRIGDTIRYAKTLLPPWGAEDDNRLVELRNFSMGVSEGRWPDNPSFRDELDTLEATRRIISAVEAARDAKVEFLEAASREEVEGYVVEDGWP